MASIFKRFTSNDVAVTRNLLHEQIPITGSVLSGTYNADGNIKNFTHGMFQAVYDYPYLSSSANHIFDITTGYSAKSNFASSTNTQNAKKINIYNQLSQILVGYDETGSIRRFDQDGDFTNAGSKIEEAFFLNFSRLLYKDEIKKGSVKLEIYSAGNVGSISTLKDIRDYGAQNDYRVNSPAGEYGILYTGSDAIAGSGVGLVYYQAGVIVLTASLFTSEFGDYGDVNSTIDDAIALSSISDLADGLRHRIANIEFNNTTELNSTIYFCRANNNEFNYSSNPTYLSSSKLNVKNVSTDEPVSYITTVGLYSADNELLAVAKVSEPVKKTPATEINLRVRIDH